MALGLVGLAAEPKLISAREGPAGVPCAASVRRAATSLSRLRGPLTAPGTEDGCGPGLAGIGLALQHMRSDWASKQADRGPRERRVELKW